MFDKIIKSLKFLASNDDNVARRTYPRREKDFCIGIIDGMSYPVQNWSKGGVAFTGENELDVNEVKNVVLRFNLADKIVDVEHKARILRKDPHRFIVEFSPLNQDIEKKFNHIVDDFHAQDFANSQR